MIKIYETKKFEALTLALLIICISVTTVSGCSGDKNESASSNKEFLFNGSDLSGWIGDTTVWKVEDKMLVGSTMEKMIDHAIWLTTEKSFQASILPQGTSLSLTGYLPLPRLLFR